jgi:peptide deformylase
MNKILKRREFGDPFLRQVHKRLSSSQIKSKVMQQLIDNMYYTLDHKKYGVGLAAPQIGEDLAISVIDTKPTPTRPKLLRYKMTIINPEIIKTYGNKKPQWEGCISGTQLFALVPRYKKIRLKYLDESAIEHEQDFEGIIAQIIQHEVDHLNGILFVDKVKDTKSYMTFKEYRKMLRAKNTTSNKK